VAIVIGGVVIGAWELAALAAAAFSPRRKVKKRHERRHAKPSAPWRIFAVRRPSPNLSRGLYLPCYRTARIATGVGSAHPVYRPSERSRSKCIEYHPKTPTSPAQATTSIFSNVTKTLTIVSAFGNEMRFPFNVSGRATPISPGPAKSHSNSRKRTSKWHLVI